MLPLFNIPIKYEMIAKYVYMNDVVEFVVCFSLCILAAGTSNFSYDALLV